MLLKTSGVLINEPALRHLLYATLFTVYEFKDSAYFETYGFSAFELISR